MKKYSAGLLVYRINRGRVEVLLVHPGGPFWAKKDLGAWSIPKGEHDGSEDALVAAKREFKEETGHQPPEGKLIELGELARKDGKLIKAWAVEGDMDVAQISSNTFEMEWPPKSGKKQEFPEIDKAQWFELGHALPKLHKGQSMFLEQLANFLDVKITNAAPGNTHETGSQKQQQLL